MAGTVSELVVGRVSHLIVVLVVRIESSATAALRREVGSVITLDRVARLASIMGSGLRSHCIRVRRDRALSHMALRESEVSDAVCA